MVLHRLSLGLCLHQYDQRERPGLYTEKQDEEVERLVA